MKRLFITLWVLIACLSISAQNKFPSQKELQEECKIIQNGLNIIDSKLDSIHFAQINKLREMGITEYDIDTLKISNKQVFDGIKEVLILIPQVYAKDTIDNIALVQFEVLATNYKEYCKAVAIGPKGIIISDNFQDVIKNVNDKISEIKGKLKDEETPKLSSEETILDNCGNFDAFKDYSLENWPFLALNAIFIIMGVVLIISHKKMNSRLKALEKKSDANKENKETGQKAPNSLNYGGAKDGRTNCTNPAPIIRRCDLDNLKSELFDEIKKVKEDIKRIQSSATLYSTQIPSSYSTENKKTSNVRNEQSQSKPAKEIYAQLQGNGSFKTYDNNRANAFFIIKQNSTSSTIGEFSLKELDPETAKSAIDDRNSLLVAACEIVETSANPRKIKVESFGTAEKRGNEWYVKDKAKISLID